MIFRPILFVSLLTLLFMAGCFKNTQPFSSGRQINAEGYYFITDTSTEITFEWKSTGTTLDCAISAPTTGWVAVGFSTNGSMDG